MRSVTTRFILATMLIAGCGSPGADRTVSASSIPARGYDAVAYDLKARFDWATQRLTATEQITVILQGTQKVELDSQVQVSRVHLGSLNLPFTQANNLLTVDVSPLETTGFASFTVEYTANTSNALIAGGARDGDPLQARVVFTDSEPDRGSQWLIANHHPSDRALWAVALTVDADEDVIANGERIIDVTRDGQRTVGYALPMPIPTYLMAFAAGQMTHTDRLAGRVPLSVWYRKGLVIDPQASLDAIADAMSTYQKLLGPYPWERYSLVLLPDFAEGGMENATITFEYESAGQGLVDFTTHAHELSHHWFGDWVTMHDFDDVWVKEGMATVLESEADRARRDEQHSGRLFGIDFDFAPSDAIVDDNLIGIDKYTSGPYQRAAWIITQIRDRVGEKNFWASLRKVLATHPLGSITGPEFVRAFAPALDDATIAQVVASLPQKSVPQVAVAVTRGTTDTSVTLTLTDSSGQMISPPRMNVIGADGSATPAPLAIGAPVTVSVPTGGYLAPDEKDVHPQWARSFGVVGAGWYALAPRFVPSSDAALAAFAARSPAHQELTFYNNLLFQYQPAQYQPLHASLSSKLARQWLEDVSCITIDILGGMGTDTTAWTQAVLPSMLNPSYLRLDYGRSGCGPGVGALIAGELASDAAAVTAANAPRIDYLLSFDQGVPGSLAAMSTVATTAPSEQLREDADYRLVAQAAYWSSYTPVTDPADVTAWQAFFERELTITTSQYHLLTLWNAVMALGDVGALPTLASKLHTITFSSGLAGGLVCQAYSLSQGQAGSWEAFQQAAQPWATLPADAQPVIADPTRCQAGASAAMKAKSVHAASAGAGAATSGLPANRPDAHLGRRRLPSPVR
jgi:aminopeptidase N